MAKSKKRTSSEGCALNMTPMIDVVFQLIIFFIVTVKMEETDNPDIVLEPAPNGPVIEKPSSQTLVIEVDKRGWISIHNARLSKSQLTKIIRSRYDRFGNFPVMIRGDRRTRHEDIRAVMDICASIGIWRVSFVAVQEKKT